MEKKFVLQILVLMVVALGAVTLGFNQNVVRNITNTINNTQTAPSTSSSKMVRILGSTDNQEKARINVAIADDMAEKTVGLGATETLAPDNGMLFLYNESKKYTYWMKGLEYPLDFIWIQNDTVADLLPDVPPPLPNTPDEALPRYTSKAPINRVLEVNSGYIAAHNIQVGDKVVVENAAIPANVEPQPSVEII